MTYWNRQKLSEVCTIIAGQSPESKYYNTSGEGLPFFQGKSDFGVIYPTIRIYCNHPTKIADKNDILLSVRAPVGPTNLAPCRICIGRGLSAIRPGKLLSTKFVLLFFKYFEAQLSSQGTGTTFKAITQNIVKNLLIPVPPLPEQERIVANIEELFSQLDAAVAELNSVKEKLAVYRQSVLKEAFEQYKYVDQELKYFIEQPRYGTSKKCDYHSGDQYTAVYRIPNIDYHNGKIDHTDIKWAEFSKEELETLRLQEEDILLIRSNGSLSLVGRAAQITDIDTNGVFAGYLIRVRVKDKKLLNPKYLLYAFSTYEVRSYIERTAKSTSGVNNINSNEIKKIKIPICLSGNQQYVVNKIEAILPCCDAIQRNIETNLQRAAALRQSILKQAFEGNL